MVIFFSLIAISLQLNGKEIMGMLYHVNEPKASMLYTSNIFILFFLFLYLT